MTTLDFELEISSSVDQTYSVIARAPVGEAAASMRFPLAPAELDNYVAEVRDKVLRSSTVSRGTPTVDEQPVRELGQRLFEALVVDDVRSLYVGSKQRAREQGSVLRLVLRVRPPELGRLPWEFLFDPGQQDYLGLTMPLVRYPEVLAPRQPLPVALPLRILGMVARPSDQHELEVADEQQRLHTALTELEREGLVELSWVAGQTYSALEDALDEGPWHVFHFVGHGRYNSETEEGVLALADQTARTRWVSADDVSRLLAEHHTLRLVVLNACDTGRSSALDAFSSTAGALVRRWIPAVVAMQFEISDSAAIQFAQTFYQSIAKWRPVDESVMRARRAMRLDHNTLEWGTPVLYLRAPQGHIFDSVGPPSRSPLDTIGAREVEALYDQALAAFWTERWDQAVVLLQQVLAHRPHRHQDVVVKLEKARHQQQLATRYAQGCAAAEAQDWDEAINAFTMVAEADPAYRDVAERLDHARRRRQIADWQAEARRLYQAEEWAAVVKIGERLHILDPAAADPDGLVTSARTKLASVEREVQIAMQYRRGLRFLDTGKWQQAIEELESLDPTYQDTAALLARARQEFASSAAAPPASPAPPRTPIIAQHPKTVQILQHRKAVSAVSFSPDGHLLATACDDKNARVWEVSSGREYLSLRHRGVRSNARWRLPNVRGRAVSFSPDGRRLATASDDETARVWDVGSGHQLAVFPHDNIVVGAVFSPDGRLLATGSEDYTARVWDVGDGTQRTLVAHGSAVRAVALSSDGNWLATASDDHTARVWDVGDGTQRTLVAHDRPVRAVAFSPDGNWLATASDDHTARVWDPTSAQQLVVLAHDNVVTGLAFSPDGNRLVTATRGKVAQIWALDVESEGD